MYYRTGFLLIFLAGLIGFLGAAQLTSCTSSVATQQSSPATEPLLEQATGVGAASQEITFLAITDSDNQDGLVARSLDPRSLSPLSDYAPLDLGHHNILAPSPNGRMLAVVTWSGSPNAVGALHLINLDTWKDSLADPQLDDFVTDLTFGLDGTVLYWAGTSARDSAHGIPRDYALYRFDIGRRERSVVTRFPASFLPWSGEAHMLPTGQLAVLGIPTNGDNLSDDVPHILTVDLRVNQISADIRLEGVKAGQLREGTANPTPSPSNDSWQYVQYIPGWAWDLERHLLYVVHADEDRVTVVDLLKGAIVKQAEIRPRHSFLDRLLRLIVPAAEAKGGPETEERAVLSCDGKRLYVLSRLTHEGQIQTTSLRVISTEAMQEVSRLDGLITDFALTPDGELLLVVQGEIGRPYGFDMMLSRDLSVLDAETLQEHFRWQSDNGHSFYLRAFSRDGNSAYLQAYTARWVEGTGWRDQRSTLERLDLNTHALISGDEYRGSFMEVVHTALR